MYFTDDSLLPENQAPLMITAVPYGPTWMPVDCTPEQKLSVTWDEQVLSGRTGWMRTYPCGRVGGTGESRDQGGRCLMTPGRRCLKTVRRTLLK